ncbi:hypothetical protein ES708_09930 [subsurface metagenome]
MRGNISEKGTGTYTYTRRDVREKEHIKNTIHTDERKTKDGPPRRGQG